MKNLLRICKYSIITIIILRNKIIILYDFNENLKYLRHQVDKVTIRKLVTRQWQFNESTTTLLIK